MPYRTLVLLSFPAILLACGPGKSEDTEPRPIVTTSTTTPTTDTTTTVIETGDTGATEVIIDCANIAVAPLSISFTASATGYHDVEFDVDGNLIGNDPGNNSLAKATQTGGYNIYVPGTSTVQQMQRLADGDLAIATYNGIHRINAAGSLTPINTALGPYGLVLGNDDMLYAAVEGDGVYRVDPATGDATEIIANLPSGSPRVLNFSPDYSRMYIGTLFGNGTVYVVDLDADLNPTTPPTAFATGVGTGTYTDTLGVDICGNLYVSDFNQSRIYRVSPTGQVQVFIDSEFSYHTHGMDWGLDIGGWRSDAFYVSQPYNGNAVAEIVTGVPSREWTGGIAINQQVP